MFSNTLSNFKSIFKKGVDFVKTVTIGTITSVKDDICQSIDNHKEFKEWQKNKNSSASSDKSE